MSMEKIKVHYFGLFAEVAQRPYEEISLKSPTLEALLYELSIKYGPWEQPFQVAVNKKIVNKSMQTTLSPADEVAILPPFAGG